MSEKSWRKDQNATTNNILERKEGIYLGWDEARREDGGWHGIEG